MLGRPLGLPANVLVSVVALWYRPGLRHLARRSRHREPTPWLVAALAALGHGDADKISEQPLSHMTGRRMTGKRRREGAASARDNKFVLRVLNLRETSQPSQHREGLVHSVPQLSYRH